LEKIPPGLQLYSVREELGKDFAGTMRLIAQMGYKTVEFAGYYDIPALQMKTILTETGLKGVSSHILLDELMSDLYGQIEYSSIIGASYIVIPHIPREQFIDNKLFEQLVTSLTWIGAELKRYGLQLAYHNHTLEFERIGGKYLLEQLTDSISSDLLKLEIDVAWMAKAGVDPVTYFPQLKGRVPLIHIKDIDREGNITEVGKGVLNFPSIYAAAKAAGLTYYFVEQDTSRHPLLSARMNLNYLTASGIAPSC
jgi:sugar phosphate isomerase/epimerase